MVILSRDYFLNLYSIINNDIQYNIENGNGIITHKVCLNDKGNSNNINDMRESFIDDGFALVEFTEQIDYKSALTWASKIIGTPVTDSSNSGKKYSKIIAEKDGKYFANTHYTQPMHTDDAHVYNTPRIIALFCERQAAYGGITTLVKFSELYEKLKDEIQPIEHLLFAEDALKLTGVKGVISRAFFYHLENNILGLVLPAFVFKLESNRVVIDILKKINYLAHIPDNQVRFRLKAGQLLIIDNFRVMHGRTKFDLTDERILYRFCFSNNTLSSNEDFMSPLSN